MAKRKLTKAQLKRKRAAQARKNFGHSRKTRSSIKPKKRKTMARKKAKKRTTKRSMSLFGINSVKAIAAALYGGMRGRTSALLAPYTARIPLGNVSDEVGMLALTTLSKKYIAKKAGIVRDALTAGQTIEMARIGEAVATGSLGFVLPGLGGSSAATTPGYKFN